MKIEFSIEEKKKKNREYLPTIYLFLWLHSNIISRDDIEKWIKKKK